MKKPLLIFLLFVSMASAKAQDQIITIKQDTTQSRIVSINVEHAAHRWLFSFQGGLAHSLTDYINFEIQMNYTGSSASDVDDYIGKLKNGYHINTNLHYLVTSYLGLGFDYNLFYSASKGKFLAQGYDMMNIPVFTTISLDERLYAHFAGLSVIFQQFLDKNKKIKISETISPGIVFFRDETRSTQYQGDSYSGSSQQYYGYINSVAKSTNYGAKGGLSIEYGFTPQLSAGLSGNFMWSRLKKISVISSEQDINDQQLGTPLNISHIDYGFSVRYKL